MSHKANKHEMKSNSSFAVHSTNPETQVPITITPQIHFVVNVINQFYAKITEHKFI